MLKGKNKGLTTKTTEGSAEQYLTLTWCPLGALGVLVVRTYSLNYYRPNTIVRSVGAT